MAILLATILLFGYAQGRIIGEPPVNTSQNQSIVRFHGSIALPDDAPETFPEHSVLQISLSDTSLADGPSISLAKKEIRVADMGRMVNITYEFEANPEDLKNIDPEIPRMAGEVSVSAVLNVGWNPHTGVNASPNDTWVRSGDYLTDTRFAVRYEPNRSDYEIDIFLVQYVRDRQGRLGDLLVM